MAEFITVGRTSVNPDAVTCAEWVPDANDPQTGSLQINIAGTKDIVFRFDTPGVAELAAAVGLGEFGAEWVRVFETREAAKAAVEPQAGPREEPPAARKSRRKKSDEPAEVQSDNEGSEP